MTFFQCLQHFFKDIGIAETARDTAKIIFDDDAVAAEGGPIQRIVNDKFPRLDWLEDYNDDAKSKIDGYYQKHLFELIDSKNIFAIDYFYNALVTGIKSYIDNNKNIKSVDSAVSAAKQLTKFFKMHSLINQSEYPREKLFSISLYVSLFFIKNNYICKNFSGLINGLDEDRKEYNEEVLSKFGCSGKPGMYATYRLANRESRPNSVALYEVAEMEYYGKGLSGVPDYQTAYDYYLKAVEQANYNPLAGWSLGYILYNYKNPKKELKNAYIAQIDGMRAEDRYQLAISYLQTSYECGCLAAANVLAKIVDDEDVPRIYKSKLKRSEEYLLLAAKGDYVYANNSLFDICYKKYLKDNTNQKLKDDAYGYLKKSVNLGEPWATNRYAWQLLTEENNKKDAFGYFKKAEKLLAANSAYNLLVYYYVPAISDDNNDFEECCGEKLDFKYINSLLNKCLASKKEEQVNYAKSIISKYGEKLGYKQ